MEHASAVTQVEKGALGALLEHVLLPGIDPPEEKRLSDPFGLHLIDVAVPERRLALEHSTRKQIAIGRDAEEEPVTAQCVEATMGNLVAQGTGDVLAERLDRDPRLG